MIRVIALAILSIALMGATTVNSHPACPDSPEKFRAFVQAITIDDRFVIQYYLQTGCGFMKEGMPATVLKRGTDWVKIRVEPEGFPPADIYTSPGSIIE